MIEYSPTLSCVAIIFFSIVYNLDIYMCKSNF